MSAGFIAIALTAHALASDAQRALAAGMNEYLSKPVSLQTLANSISRCLRGAAPVVGTHQTA